MTRTTGTLLEGIYIFVIISPLILLRMRNVSHNVVEKNKTHILCSVTFFWKWCHFLGNVEKYGRAGQATDGSVVGCMRFACWMTRATDTLRICNSYCLSVATVVTWMCLSVMSYVRCLSCYILPMLSNIEAKLMNSHTA